MKDPSPPDPPPSSIVFGEEDGSAVRRALELPEIIDQRYRVIARLGAGAMGIVLRAEDMFLQRPVAIKVVEPGPQIVDRFLKEAQALAQVRHENVVQVYSCGPLQSSYFLAMELVTGEPLESVIDAYTAAGQMFPLPRARRIIRAIGLGLEAVHAQKLVHRDVKPGNIMLEKSTDRPVLIDFGLARKRSVSSPRLSITGGTPSYMAPEQARDPDGRRVTARTDLYAFACTVFELLTGHPVFEGADVYTVLLAHFNDKPRNISSLRPELAGIDEVMIRALAKDPEARQASVTEFLDALDAGLDGRLPTPRHINLPPTATPTTASARHRFADRDSPAETLAAPASPHAQCVLILAADPGLRRSLVRNTTQTLKTRTDNLGFESAVSASEAATFLAAADCRLVLLDEESAAGRLAELVNLARGRGAEVIIISRDFQATAALLGGTRVRHLVPKPVNIHVLAAVLGRVDLAGVPPSVK